MRHGKRVNHLGRTSSHRKAMLSNMAVSLIKNKKLVTTLAKAKALRSFVEPLINRSKEDTTHNRRTVFAYLQDKYAVTELFREISTKVAERPGGYTRILKLGFRKGDGAELALIELVDYNTFLVGTKEKKQEKTGRTRRSKRKASEPKAEAPAKASVAETTEEAGNNQTEEKAE
ncbi:MAG: 50S ribosomal protein L17 [Bacteroidales bacterium]|nr:50S ribosomal protein L17 [Bacteroidales bacterium]NPV36699.1 50S ribosomal protein L17 [Bacteroidales bacterium]